MRIALVPSAYAPAVGGVERLTSRLAAHLIGRGHEVEVWTMRHPPALPAEETVDGVTVRRFPFYLPPGRPRSLVKFPREASRALRLVRRAARLFGPDIVHVQCFGVNGVYALALAEWNRLPLVVTLQGETVMDDEDIYERSVALRGCLRLALRRARAVTACSRFVLDDVVHRFGVPRGRTEVIFNGVDPSEDREDFAIDIPFRRFIVAVGRLVYKKGFDLLLNAFARLPETISEVGLVIVGEGPSLPDLQRAVTALELDDRVLFTGPLQPGLVMSVLKRAELFVLPSRVEPFGIVILEAMLAGCPVVVSERGGVKEIVEHDVTGLVIDPHDAYGCAAVLEVLLTDEILQRRLSLAAAERVRLFLWDRVAAQYENVYRSVSGRCPSAR